MSEGKLEKARKNINEIDNEMAKLFEMRMAEVKSIAEYKKENNLPIFDLARESEVISCGSELIRDKNLKGYYRDLLQASMDISKKYQADLIAHAEYERAEAEGANIKDAKILRLNLCNGGYNIYIGSGLIARAKDRFNLNRKVIIVTDSGVPSEYARGVMEQCSNARVITLPEGEESKSMENLSRILKEMIDFGMTRTDCVVAVGGGVCGDIAGLAAASFMRGVDFYNIPTTLLSQVDSSIGGKVAINFGGVKNIVGAFYQPSGVIVDPRLLRTLDKRQIANGMAEAVKMALCFDEKLFELIENNEISEDILEQIIIGSLKIKKDVVECDEREGGVRKVLNLGHTLGHGIEALEMGRLYHGECVAIGMTRVCSDEVLRRLIPLLNKLGLPVEYSGDISEVTALISHDKKCDGGLISAIFVDKIGSYRIEKIGVEDFCRRVNEGAKK